MANLNNIKINVTKGIFMDLVGSLQSAVDKDIKAKKVVKYFPTLKFKKSQIRDLQDSIEFCRLKIKFGNEIPNNYYNYLIGRLVNVVEK